MSTTAAAPASPKLKNINILLDKYLALRMDAAEAGIPMQQMLDEILALWIEVRRTLADPTASPRSIVAELAAELARRRQHTNPSCRCSSDSH